MTLRDIPKINFIQIKVVFGLLNRKHFNTGDIPLIPSPP
jgi:hypothetical protein